MCSKAWFVCAEVAGLQFITIANDNECTFGRFNLLAKSHEYEWDYCVYFLKQVIIRVIEISTGQVQLRGLHGARKGCFKIIFWIVPGNHFIQGSKYEQTKKRRRTFASVFPFTYSSECEKGIRIQLQAGNCLVNVVTVNF
jgi:hypothetical protein